MSSIRRKASDIDMLPAPKHGWHDAASVRGQINIWLAYLLAVLFTRVRLAAMRAQTRR
jgi:hypothetical protein